MATAEEVARAYKVSKHTIYELCRQNLLPHLRFGRLVRIERCVLHDPDVMRQALSRFSGPAAERQSVRRPSPRHPQRRPPGTLARPFPQPDARKER